MAKKKLKTKSLAQPVTLAVAASSGTNDGLDRAMTVTGRTTEGIPLQVASFRIVQPGLREPFVPADSAEGLEDSTGEVLAVLKK